MSKPYFKESFGSTVYTVTTANEANPTPSTFRQLLSWSRTANGTTNPIWRDQVARKHNATTNFTARGLTVEHSDGIVEVKGYVNGVQTPLNQRYALKKGWLVFSDGRGNLASSVMDGGAESIASSRFYSDLAGQLKALEGGELLGELGRTAKTIMNHGRSLRDLLLGPWKRNMRRLRNTSARQRAAMVSSAYLEWKFGWDPLVKDIQSLIGGLEYDYFDFIPFSVSGTRDFGKTSSVSTGSMGQGLYDIVEKTSHSSTVRYKGDFRVYRAGLGALVGRVGLSPTNFLPTLYNLLPWTYMIDYFTNLGDIVQALAIPNVDTHVAWCARTVRNRTITEHYAGGNFRQASGIVSDAGYPIVVPSKTVWTNTYVARTSALPSRLPGLRLKGLDFSREGDRWKGLNIAAVLASRTWGGQLVRGLVTTG